MHNLKGIFAFIIIATSFASLYSQSGGLRVYVYDKKTKAPLKGVYLNLSSRYDKGKAMRTDSSGGFVYKNIPYGKYDFYCSPNDSKIKYKSIFVYQFDFDSDLTLKCYAKRRRDFFFNQFIGRINFQQGWRGMGEVSLGIAHYDEDNHRHMPDMYYLQSIDAGCQFNFSQKHFVIGPSISYHNTASILHCGISFIYFTDFEKGTPFINPQLGFSWNTYFDFYFGYNIPLVKNEMKGLVNKFNFTVSVPLFDRMKSDSQHFRYSKKRKKLVRGY